MQVWRGPGAAIITPGPGRRQMMQSTAGIDVGKRELDVSVDEDRARRFANTAAGVAELVGWLGSQGPLLAVCEATGGYEALVVQALRQVGVPVHIAHPNQVRAFARACGYQAKTDGLDAMLLPRYGPGPPTCSHPGPGGRPRPVAGPPAPWGAVGRPAHPGWALHISSRVGK